MTVKIDTDAEINSVRLKEVAAPATPASGYGQLFVKTDGKIYFKNDSGLEVDLTLTGTASSGADIGARVYKTTDLVVSNNTPTFVPFDAERWDTDGIHSGSSTQLYCNTAGKYLIKGHIYWGFDADGYRQLVLMMNRGTTLNVIQLDPVQSSVATAMEISTIYNLSVGNYVELRVLHTAGGDLSVVAGGNFSPEFMIQKIG